jgi:hypothetical protein
MADLSAAPVQEDVTSGSRIQHGCGTCGGAGAQSTRGRAAVVRWSRSSGWLLTGWSLPGLHVART